jgi:hypothetical protein
LLQFKTRAQPHDRSTDLNMSLAGQVGDRATTCRQLSLIGNENGKSVLDAKANGAAATDQLIVLKGQFGLAWVQGAAEDLQKLLVDHQSTCFISTRTQVRI